MPPIQKRDHKSAGTRKDNNQKSEEQRKNAHQNEQYFIGNRLAKANARNDFKHPQ